MGYGTHKLRIPIHHEILPVLREFYNPFPIMYQDRSPHQPYQSSVLLRVARHSKNRPGYTMAPMSSSCYQTAAQPAEQCMQPQQEFRHFEEKQPAHSMSDSLMGQPDRCGDQRREQQADTPASLARPGHRSPVISQTQQ